MSEVRQSLGEIPMVEDEMKKATGEEGMADESIANTVQAAPTQKLVTADGTYATQSAFSTGASATSKADAEKVKLP